MTRFPLDVRRRRTGHIHYMVQLSCARETWVASHGQGVASSWKFSAIRRVLRKGKRGYIDKRRIRKLLRVREPHLTTRVRIPDFRGA